MSWIRKMYKIAMSSILILIVTFLMGEIMLQILRPQLPYQFTPQKILQDFWIDSDIVEATLKKTHKSRFLMSAASFDSMVETNSLGWRDNEPDNRDKILVMGDSFTFGFGVNNNQTIPYHLEKIYNNRYDFINLGYTAGFSPDSYAAYLRFHKKLQGNPTILILYVNDWNDIKNNVCIYNDGHTIQSPSRNCNKVVGLNTLIINGKLSHNPNFIHKIMPSSVIYYLKQSYLIGAIRTIYSQFSNSVREIEAIKSANDMTSSDKEKLFNLLNDIYDLTGGNLTIVMLSDSVQNQFYSMVKIYCEDNSKLQCLGIPSVDSKKHFKNDAHFNHIGTEYIANIISSHLDKVLFFDK